jgi:hypothetical protein
MFALDLFERSVTLCRPAVNDNDELFFSWPSHFDIHVEEEKYVK